MFFALLVSWACDQPIDCSDPATPLAQAGERSLTCHEAGWAIGWVGLLAARPVPRADRSLVYESLQQRFQADPEATERWLEQVRGAGEALAGAKGLAGAEARATKVWEASAGEGLIGEDAGALWSVQKRTLAVWSSSAERKLALTEADIEAWLRYGSLCREAQQGGTLRISVADRVSVYRMIQDRFDAGTRADQVALSSMGPAWNRVPDAWSLASYNKQQAWISEAPLPPPMTATSLGYASALFEGDVARHASVLHELLGPFLVGTGGPSLALEVPSR